jgi:hypothetical protein
MARYLVEREYPNGFGIEPEAGRPESLLAIVERNVDAGVTWLHSYVREDRTKTFCIYDGPSPEAIRKAAARNGFPVDRITEVRVLDPYFYPRDQVRLAPAGQDRHQNQKSGFESSLPRSRADGGVAATVSSERRASAFRLQQACRLGFGHACSNGSEQSRATGSQRLRNAIRHGTMRARGVGSASVSTRKGARNGDERGDGYGDADQDQ